MRYVYVNVFNIQPSGCARNARLPEVSEPTGIILVNGQLRPFLLLSDGQILCDAFSIYLRPDHDRRENHRPSAVIE